MRPFLKYLRGDSPRYDHAPAKEKDRTALEHGRADRTGPTHIIARRRTINFETAASIHGSNSGNQRAYRFRSFCHSSQATYKCKRTENRPLLFPLETQFL